MKKCTTIGGQALIEGIMMKGPNKTALAVRMPDGSIDVEYMTERRIKDKIPVLGWPIIRGAVNLIEAMTQGYKALMISADKSGLADLDEAPKSKPEVAVVESAPTPTEQVDLGIEDVNSSTESTSEEAVLEEISSAVVPEASTETKEKPKNKAQDKLMGVLMLLASVLGIGLAIVLFMYVPALLFNLFNKSLGSTVSNWRGLFEGVLKITLFVGYIAVVSLMNDIKRVFMYHGAEHKTIFCYEQGLELNIENIRKQSRFHPRCGTSFMIIMLVVGIAISVIISISFPALTHYTWLWVSIKILMLPLICGLGYELIRICGRYDNLFTKIISAPGMWLQRLTTKEPDDSMIEVAIRSLEAVLPENPDEDRW